MYFVTNNAKTTTTTPKTHPWDTTYFCLYLPW